MTFTAALTIGSTHTNGYMVLFRSMETSPSIISAETRCVMDAVTRRLEGATASSFVASTALPPLHS